MSALLPSGRAMLTGGLTSTTCGAERERPLVERRVTTPTHAPSPPGRGRWSRAAACSQASKASLPAAPPASPAQQQQRARLVRQPQSCPWLRAAKRKRARHEREQQRRTPGVLRNSGAEAVRGAVITLTHQYRMEIIPPFTGAPRVFSGCAPPPAHLLRRSGSACRLTSVRVQRSGQSSTDAGHQHTRGRVAGSRRAAVQQRRAQAAAVAQCVPACAASGPQTGPCAPTLSATAFVSAADPWEHVVAAGLGGMVGSYVVAWEVRVQRCAVLHASPAFARPSRKCARSLAGRSA